MLSPIIVPLDGSALAERALAPAAAVARQCQAELRLLRVAVPQRSLIPADPVYALPLPGQSLAEAQEEADRYLATIQAALAADRLAAHRTVRFNEYLGNVASAVVEAAREAEAGLIIMSSHGYTGVQRLLLGSVAEGVLGAAPCPVWMVRTPKLTEHILIPLDGSRLAEAVLAPALAVARCLRARVTLLRVLPSVGIPEVNHFDTLERGLGRRYMDERNEEAQDYLAQVVDRFGDEGLDLRTAVWSGLPAASIIEYARWHAVDLVAMTTHGRTGLSRLLYGSVTQTLLQQLRCSMLVVRSGTASEA